jgi:uncharacterized protein YyaL (SSP411 family)
MLEAELSLYETTGHVAYLDAAIELSEQITDLFWDAPQQAFFRYVRAVNCARRASTRHV